MSFSAARGLPLRSNSCKSTSLLPLSGVHLFKPRFAYFASRSISRTRARFSLVMPPKRKYGQLPGQQPLQFAEDAANAYVRTKCIEIFDKTRNDLAYHVRTADERKKERDQIAQRLKTIQQIAAAEKTEASILEARKRLLADDVLEVSREEVVQRLSNLLSKVIEEFGAKKPERGSTKGECDKTLEQEKMNMQRFFEKSIVIAKQELEEEWEEWRAKKEIENAATLAKSIAARRQELDDEMKKLKAQQRVEHEAELEKAILAKNRELDDEWEELEAEQRTEHAAKLARSVAAKNQELDKEWAEVKAKHEAALGDSRKKMKEEREGVQRELNSMLERQRKNLLQAAATQKERALSDQRQQLEQRASDESQRVRAQHEQDKQALEDQHEKATRLAQASALQSLKTQLQNEATLSLEAALEVQRQEANSRLRGVIKTHTEELEKLRARLEAAVIEREQAKTDGEQAHGQVRVQEVLIRRLRAENATLRDYQSQAKKESTAAIRDLQESVAAAKREHVAALENQFDESVKELKERFARDIEQRENDLEARLVAAHILEKDLLECHLNAAHKQELDEVRVELTSESKQAIHRIKEELTIEHEKRLLAQERSLVAKHKQQSDEARAELTSKGQEATKRAEEELSTEHRKRVLALKHSLHEKHQGDAAVLRQCLLAEREMSLKELQEQLVADHNRAKRSEVAKLAEQHDLDKRELRRQLVYEHDREISRLGTKHEEDTRSLQDRLDAEHHLEMYNLKAQLNEERRKRTQELQDLVAENDAQTKIFLNRLEQEHDSDKKQLTSRLMAEHETNKKALESRLVTEHQERRKDLKDSMTKDCDERLSQLAVEHNKHVQDLMLRLEALNVRQLSEKEAQLDAEHKVELETKSDELVTKANQRLEAQKAELQDLHAQELGKAEQHLSNVRSELSNIEINGKKAVDDLTHALRSCRSTHEESKRYMQKKIDTQADQIRKAELELCTTVEQAREQGQELKRSLKNFRDSQFQTQEMTMELEECRKALDDLRRSSHEAHTRLADAEAQLVVKDGASHQAEQYIKSLKVETHKVKVEYRACNNDLRESLRACNDKASRLEAQLEAESQALQVMFVKATHFERDAGRANAESIRLRADGKERESRLQRAILDADMLRAVICERDKSLEQTLTKIARLEESSEGLKSLLDHARLDADRLTTDVRERDDSLERASAKMVRLSAESEELRASLRQTTANAKRLEADVRDKVQSLEQVDLTLRGFKTQVQQLLCERDEMKGNITAKVVAWEQFNADLCLVRRSYDDERANTANLASQLATSKELWLSHQEDIDKYKQKLATVEDVLREEREKTNALEIEREEFLEMAELEAKKRQEVDLCLEQAFGDLKEQKIELAKRISDLTRERSRSRRVIDDLEHQVLSLKALEQQAM